MLEDAQLIQLYQSGRIEAMDTLIERHHHPLYKFCCHLTRNREDADDLFQDTWRKVIKNLDGFQKDRTFQTWLFSIALNTYKDGYRKSKRWLNRVRVFFSNDTKELEMNRIESPVPAADDQLVRNEQTRELRKCIDTLEDTFRIPLILFYFKEMSYDEIAEILDIPMGTVKSRLSSAKAKLRKMLEVKESERT